MKRTLTAIVTALFLLSYPMYFRESFAVNSTIKKARAAFEAEELAACMDMISETYEDSRGDKSQDIKEHLRGLFETQADIKTVILGKRKQFQPSEISFKK